MCTKKNKELTGIFITLLGGILWGLSGVCGQFLFQERNVTSNWLVPVRLILAGGITLLFFVLRDGKKTLKIWKGKRNCFDLLIYSIFGMMLCQYTYFAAIELSNAATATILQYFNPAIIIIAVCIMEQKLPQMKEVIGVVLAMIGVFFIATHGDIQHLIISEKVLWIGLFSACTVAVYTLQPRRMLQSYEPAFLLGWAMLIGGCILSVFVRPWNYLPPEMDFVLMAGLGIIVLLGTIGAFIFYTTGVKLIGPAKASLFACIEPIFSAFLSSLWLKVPFTGMDFLGFICILSTIFITSMSKKQKELVHSPVKD
ncbi:MAG: EamA family transporter [Clostridiales bacterium]|nr:EamA family transporter [Clostridiales bacterium]